jgi:hypothetical protein
MSVIARSILELQLIVARYPEMCNQYLQVVHAATLHIEREEAMCAVDKRRGLELDTV